MDAAGTREKGRSLPGSLLRIGGWVVSGSLGIVLALLLLLQVDAVSTAVGRWLVEVVSSPGLRISVDRVEGSWIRSLELTDLEVSAGPPAREGGWELAADSLRLSYRLLPLLRRTLELEEVEGAAVRFGLGLRPDTTRASPEEESQDPWRIRVSRIGLRGSELRIWEADQMSDSPPGRGEVPWTLSNLRLRAGGLSVEEDISVTLDTLTGRFRPRGTAEPWGQLRASLRYGEGTIRVDTLLLESPESRLVASGVLPTAFQGTLPEGLTMGLSAEPLHLGDLGPLLPPSLPDSLRVRASGSARSEEGGLIVLVQADAGEGGSLELDAVLRENSDSAPSRLSLRLEELDLRTWGLAAEGRRVGLVLEARGDSLQGPWNGDWSMDTRGVAARGAAAVAPGPRLLWEVDGDLTYDPAAGAPLLPGLEDSPLRVGFDWEGEGTGLDSLRARGEATAEPLSSGERLLRDLVERITLRGQVDGGEARLSLDALVGGGTLTGEGRIGLASLPEVRASGRIRIDSARARGFRIDSVDLEVEARNQELGVRGMVAAEDSARARLTGRIQAAARMAEDGWSAEGSMTVDSSWVGTEVIRGGRVDVRAHRQQIDVELDLELAEGSITGNARVEEPASQPRVVLPELRFRGLDPGAFLARSGPAVRLSGRLEGEVQGTGPREVRGSGTLVLDSSSVAGVAVSSATLEVDARDGRITATLDGETLEGSFHLEGGGNLTAQLPTYQARGRIRQGHLMARQERDRPRGSLDVRFEVEGEGFQPDSLTADAWIQVDSARWDEVHLEAGSLELAMADGVARLDTLVLESRAFSISGRGDLPLSMSGDRQGEMRLTGTVHRADMLASLVGAEILDVGEARFEARATGSADRLALEAETRINALLVDEIRVQGLELLAQGRRTAEEGFSQATARLTVDRLRTPTAPIRRLETELTLEEADEVAVDASAVIDDSREASLFLRLDHLRAPSEIRLERFDVRADEDQWALQHPTRLNLTEGLEVDSLVLLAGDQSIRLGGRIAGSGPLSLSAHVSGFRIGTLSDLLGVPALQGRLDASLALSGRARAPRLEADLQGRLDAGEGTAPSVVDMAARYQERVLTVDASTEIRDGRGLRLDGTLPLDLSLAGGGSGLLDDENVDIEVRVDSLPLEWVGLFLPPEGVEDPTGILDGRVLVGGQAGDPALEGTLALRDAAVGLPPLGVAWSRIRGDIHLEGDRAILDSLRIRSGDGTLRASGSVTATSLDEPEYALDISANRFQAVASGGVNATVSGQVELRGTPLRPTAEGNVRIVRSDFYLDDLATSPDVEDVTLTEEDYQELGRVFGYRQAPDMRATSEVFDSTTLDIAVSIQRDSWVRQRSNPELAVQLTGDFSVEKESGDSLRLVGAVEAIPARSYVEQFGRRFSLAEGRFAFRGPPMATQVQLRAEYEVPSRDNPDAPEVLIALEISGTPEDLNLELSSSPPLEASDMISYLAVGQPAGRSLGSSGEDSSLSETGQAVALAQLSNAVEAYAREQVGLDVVEITTNGTEGVTLLAGRYVSPDLYLGVRQPMSFQRSTGDASERTPTTRVEVELQAVRWLLLNLQAGGRPGVEFFVRSRLSYD